MASRSAKNKEGRSNKIAAGNVYNAKGSPEMSEAEDEKADFKKGGKAKKHKHGGHAEGKMAKERGDKKPRGHKRAAGGRAPYTSGHNLKAAPESGETNSGHESQRP